MCSPPGRAAGGGRSTCRRSTSLSCFGYPQYCLPCGLGCWSLGGGTPSHATGCRKIQQVLCCTTSVRVLTTGLLHGISTQGESQKEKTTCVAAGWPPPSQPLMGAPVGSGKGEGSLRTFDCAARLRLWQHCARPHTHMMLSMGVCCADCHPRHRLVGTSLRSKWSPIPTLIWQAGYWMCVWCSVPWFGRWAVLGDCLGGSQPATLLAAIFFGFPGDKQFVGIVSVDVFPTHELDKDPDPTKTELGRCLHAALRATSRSGSGLRHGRPPAWCSLSWTAGLSKCEGVCASVPVHLPCVTYVTPRT